MIRGSYYNGFAPRDGMPLYPSLWRGCVGAWAPCLGPTGLTLRDWSGYGNHGTLTNMAADSDWVVHGGAYCLDFDNTDDGVNCGSTNRFAFTSAFSFSCWFRTFLVSDYVLFCGRFQDVANTGFLCGVYLSKVFFQLNTVLNTAGATPTVNTWTHYAATWDGSTIRVYMNAGIPDTAATTSLSAPSTSMWIGNYASPTIAPMNGQLDDIRLYNRVLNPNEITLLSRRRGIAYDMMPMTMLYSAAGFQAAWALRQRQILGGGGGLG